LAKKKEAEQAVHERLYKSNKDPIAKLGRVEQPKMEFVPHINEKSKKIQRPEKIEELLTEDAKRRKEKKEQSEK
jgi:hypothetical protein